MTNREISHFQTLLVVLALAACGGNESSTKTQPKSTTSQSTTENQSDSTNSQDANAATQEGHDHSEHTDCLHEDHCHTAEIEDTSGESNTDDLTPTPENQPTAVPAGDPKLVMFSIAAGTGNKSWNTKATIVTAKINQVVRIVNNDTVAHRLHTGGAPCPHQNGTIAPGKFFDCVVTKTLEPGATAPTYDHIAGPTAQFWVRTTN